jgi:hypothetical protein
MATIYKVLAQSAPLADTATNAYTVPSATSAILSTVVVCNRDTSADVFDIAIRPAGASLANEHYIAKNVTVGASDSTTLTLGITLATTDVLTVRGGTANLSFNLFGSEITE